MRNKMNLAPIVLFVYNRPEHTKRTLDCLSLNAHAAESDLFIFSDGPKSPDDKEKIDRVRSILGEENRFKSVSLNLKPENIGLADSVIEGVSEIIDRFGKVIVVEDDIYTANNFLSFLNNALNQFENTKSVYSISGYGYPIQVPDYFRDDVYLFERSCSWGWATWKDRWDSCRWNLDESESIFSDKKIQKQFNAGGNDLTEILKKYLFGVIDSWAIRWAFCHFENEAFCLYPRKSFVSNAGMDGSGTHFRKRTNYLAVVLDERFTINSLPAKPFRDELINSRVKGLLKRGPLKKLFFNFRYELPRRFNKFQ